MAMQAFAIRSKIYYFQSAFNLLTPSAGRFQTHFNDLNDMYSQTFTQNSSLITIINVNECYVWNELV